MACAVTIDVPGAARYRIAPRRRRRFTASMSTIDDGLNASLEADAKAVAVLRDREAFHRLFDHYAPRVKSYLRRLGAGEDVAEDLMQEVMLTIWRRAEQFDPRKAALSTWIFTIARNKRIDAIRRERRPDFDAEDPLIEPDSAPRGDRALEAAQLSRAMMEAVRTLPEEQSSLLRIFYFEDKTHSTIAEELGLPLGTVKSRLRLALGKLRTIMSGLDQ
jgi:RNA polymerase sigma-70 factor (ECF subfamily)